MSLSNHLETIITPTINLIGATGNFGFGVEVVPDTLVSMYDLIGFARYDNPISPNYGNYLHVLSWSVLVYTPKHHVKYI